MERIQVTPRSDWKRTAEEHGFTFHSPDDDQYWNESAYYRFTLKQIENDLESAANKLEQLCFEVVDAVTRSEQLLTRLRIPREYWDYIAQSWHKQERNLYGRMDFAYDGRQPPKLLEYNADTPTSLYETAIFQWVWLEQAMERNLIPKGCDQFNAMHEDLVAALGKFGIDQRLYFACAKGSAEDLGTIEYLEDCAKQAEIETARIFIEEIGVDERGRFTDLDDMTIPWLFKLYPWEWLLRDDFAKYIPKSGTRFIEPAWKAILSNKGLLPLLWEKHRGHPNLLPAFFEDDEEMRSLGGSYVRKPLYSREGWNIEMFKDGMPVGAPKEGGYGEEGYVRQGLSPLPDMGGVYPMCGVWLIASEAAGMGIREDRSLVTTDDAHFVPHVILDRS
jgi:glutathionylspermidine synthase